MMEEWKKEVPRYTPGDSRQYFISEKVMQFTAKILRQYGRRQSPSEGLVYWGGLIKDDNVYVSACVAPKIKASRYNISIDHYSNFRVVKVLSANRIVHLGQVHSHPSDWVDHSPTDDEFASFKVEGLLSLVVPDFALHGMKSLPDCGIHRFTDGKFRRLSNTYIKQRFHIITNIESHIIDLRNEK